MSTDPPWRQPRTLADFDGLEGLRPAERKLLEERDTGLRVVIGDGKLPPEDAPEDRRVRARFLRWLILGAEGAEGRTHEKGVRIVGAFVESDGPVGAARRGLDLEGCAVAQDVGLFDCRFEHAPLLRSARLQGLYLNRSGLPGLGADGLTTTGNMFLRGVESDVEIRLLGARIGGSLDCDGAKLRNADGDALSADGLTTTGDVFLRGVESDGGIRLLGASIGGNLSCIGARLRNADGNTLHADGLVTTGDVFLRGVESDGEIRLPGARIGGSLVCDGAKLRNADGDALSADSLTTTGNMFLRGVESDGAVRLLGASIGGDLSCIGAKLRNADGNALSASNARIESILFLRGSASVEGVVDLRAARIGVICDALPCWPDTVQLDRCTYDAFVACPTDADTRIAWLDKTDNRTGFLPQPWEQCAKVLRETGHAEDARAVLIEKERRQRRARRKASSWWWGRLLWLWDGLLGATVRYGRQSMLAFAWLLGFWLAGIGVFGGASALDAIKPNNAFVLRAPEWVLCGVEAPQRVFLPSLRRLATGRAEPGESQRDCFEGEREAAQYPAFDPIVYSLDTLLPVVEMEMQAFWIPDERASWLGAAARVYLWVHIFVGWALSLLAVAGFSGLVKSN